MNRDNIFNIFNPVANKNVFYHIQIGLLLVGLWIVQVTHAAETVRLQLDGHFIQGGMVIGSTEPDAKVTLDGEPLALTKQGYFVFGFGRDSKPNHQLTVTYEGAEVKRQLVVKQRRYKIQKIEGVPQKTVTPPKKALQRILKETQLVKEARAEFYLHEHFLKTFKWPLKGPITGVYGSQRFYNGVPKRPHFGLDIAGPIGAVVTAPIPGLVTLVHDDMYYSGGTVILDHGYGISSTFIHLSSVLVKKGQWLDQGDALGKVGAGGRATGPHLDWRMNWFKKRLDPQLIMMPEVVIQEAGSK